MRNKTTRPKCIEWIEVSKRMHEGNVSLMMLPWRWFQRRWFLLVILSIHLGFHVSCCVLCRINEKVKKSKARCLEASHGASLGKERGYPYVWLHVKQQNLVFLLHAIGICRRTPRNDGNQTSSLLNPVVDTIGWSLVFSFAFNLVLGFGLATNSSFLSSLDAMASAPSSSSLSGGSNLPQSSGSVGWSSVEAIASTPYLRVSRSGPGPRGVISNTVGRHSTVPFSEHLLGVLSIYLSMYLGV